MKRRAIRQVVVFLLLGAIVNVGVAWAAAIFFPPRDSLETIEKNHLLETLRLRMVSYSYESRTKEFLIGNAFSSWTANAAGIHCQVRPTSVYDSALPKREDGLLMGLQVMHGWPVHSMFGERWDNWAWPIRYPPNYIKAIDASDWPMPGSPRVTRLIPLRPLWPGFAINTVFYAASVAVMFVGPGMVRRAVRRRRGLCPACGYPIGSSDKCTECGAAVSEWGG